MKLQIWRTKPLIRKYFSTNYYQFMMGNWVLTFRPNIYKIKNLFRRKKSDW